MSRNTLRTIIAAMDPSGDVESIRQLIQEAAHADAIVLIGNLAAANSRPRSYAAVLKELGESQVPVFYVPGLEEAPFHEFLRQAANFEVVFSRLRCVHGTFAPWSGSTLFTGVGGLVEDDPGCERDEVSGLRYPGWEVEYRLKFLHDMKDYPKVFLFSTAVAHKGVHHLGSNVLAELVKTFNPHLVVVGGASQSHELMGSKSLIVCPGELKRGNYATVDLQTNDVLPTTLGRSRAA